MKTLRIVIAGAVLALGACMGARADTFDPLTGSGAVTRTQLTASYLLQTATDPGTLIDFAAYALPAGAANPTNTFEGTLTLNGTATSGGFQEVVDTYNYTGTADTTRKHLPPFSFQFIQTGTHLFPLLRGANASTHPEWEFVLVPGRVWNEAGDGGYSRAALPFTLMQKNQNCVHNGVMTFLFKTDGSISKVSYQIASETCEYFKFNMYGVLSATYTPQAIPNAAALTTAYQSEVAAKLPVRPIAALATDYPAAGIDVSKLLAPNGTDATQVTTVGFVVNGVHYRGGCTTRFGDYPFCENVVLPSYSTAKSAFAGAALMRLQAKHPGAASLLLKDWVPACNNARWTTATFANALDMATGNYKSASYEVDEGGTTMSTFFADLTHADKINLACTAWPHKTAPGTKWVYHSSDDYVLGAAMNAYLKSVEGATKDIFADIVVGELWSAIDVGPTARYTRRTYDTTAQPFTAYGLLYEPDDIAKIATFMGPSHGAAGGTQLLDTAMLDAAMQRTPSDPGLVPLTDYRYQNGLWAWNAKTWLGCANDTYIPFMSGFGGNTVVLMPNNTIYYIFSDNDTYYFADALKESAKITPLCH